MKRKIYIETTVVSYLTARKSTDPVVAGHQQSTQDFWSRMNQFDVYVSDLVVREAGRGDPERAKDRIAALQAFPVLEADDEARALAAKLIEERAIPSEFPDDAAHIAIAAVNGVDFLVTWNFAHINNPFTKLMIRQIVENVGFVAPEICTPEELMEGET